MKRGLVVLDPSEIPPGELEGRVGALQDVLRERGLAAALIYGDVFHSGDLTYLSNICIYWNEGVLAVPANGSPAMLMKLSPRVHPWMRMTSNLSDLRSGPNLAVLAGQYLKEQGASELGLVEMSWWPAQLVDELETQAGIRSILDLGSVVRERRQQPSESELELLSRGSGLTAQAVIEGMGQDLSNHERAGRAELVARLGGAEDVSVYCHHCGPDADTVEVISEFRGFWTLAARVVGGAQTEWAGALATGYEAAASEIRPGVTIAQVASAVQGCLASTGLGWKVDLIQHTDIETEAGYRSIHEAAASVGEGSVAALRLELELPDGSTAVLADTYLIRGEDTEVLTSPLPGIVSGINAAEKSF
ncbi:MAG: hypothetical protein HKL84_05945 [Acidimicrobiaceae bacterium]|nr:hypothetical protein [Acidimicrobiaceae bacterium]